MKYFFKRFWILLLLAILINIPLLVLGTVRTNKTVTLKGDTTIVKDFVEIANPYEAKGTLSTIYVISLDHSTILQNWMVGLSSTSELEDLPEHYLHFTDSELVQMGRIQHESSIMYALMLAYQAASATDPSIHLEHSFDAYVVAYYDSVSEFRIGDRIIGVDQVYADADFDQFAELFNKAVSAEEPHTFQVMRQKKELEITNTKENLRIAGYSYYNLNQKTASPQYKIKQTNVGGPSGGLLQTLALYNSLVPTDITQGRHIAGTGTIEPDGTVGPIGGIQQKIYTAFEDDMDIFLCPKENYEEALLAYNTLKNKERMKLYSIESFTEALEVLTHEF